MNPAKQRNNNAMPSSIGATRRIYLSNNLYDQLLQEAGEMDLTFSQLIRKKIELFDKIKFLILKNIGVKEDVSRRAENISKKES